uniref:Uncharacterized protein n=1 Tax=Anguilla anguilla TaxID=7936 RepID=A0A0E9VLH3_ANGAN
MLVYNFTVEKMQHPCCHWCCWLHYVYKLSYCYDFQLFRQDANTVSSPKQHRRFISCI